jgi:hypothetical protein
MNQDFRAPQASKIARPRSCVVIVGSITAQSTSISRSRSDLAALGQRSSEGGLAGTSGGGAHIGRNSSIVEHRHSAGWVGSSTAACGSRRGRRRAGGSGAADRAPAADGSTADQAVGGAAGRWPSGGWRAWAGPRRRSPHRAVPWRGRGGYGSRRRWLVPWRRRALRSSQSGAAAQSTSATAHRLPWDGTSMVRPSSPSR